MITAGEAVISRPQPFNKAPKSIHFKFISFSLSSLFLAPDGLKLVSWCGAQFRLKRQLSKGAPLSDWEVRVGFRDTQVADARHGMGHFAIVLLS
jgi:hypothetical protein